MFVQLKKDFLGKPAGERIDAFRALIENTPNYALWLMEDHWTSVSGVRVLI